MNRRERLLLNIDYFLAGPGGTYATGALLTLTVYAVWRYL